MMTDLVVRAHKTSRKDFLVTGLPDDARGFMERLEAALRGKAYVFETFDVSAAGGDFWTLTALLVMAYDPITGPLLDAAELRGIAASVLGGASG